MMCQDFFKRIEELLYVVIKENEKNVKVNSKTIFYIIGLCNIVVLTVLYKYFINKTQYVVTTLEIIFIVLVMLLLVNSPLIMELIERKDKLLKAVNEMNEKTVTEVLYLIKNKIDSKEYDKLYKFIKDRNGFEMKFNLFKELSFKEEFERINKKEKENKLEEIKKKKMLLAVAYKRDV